jgi:hypothetical protein
MRSFVFGLFSMFLAAAGFAQPIVNGSIVLLRAPNQRYLSAIPSHDLGLTTNTDAWEQWEVKYRASYIGEAVSYHGTYLIVVGASSAQHVPQGNDTPMAIFPVTSDPLVSGSKVRIGGNAGDLIEKDGMLAMQTSATPADKYWTIVIAPQIAAGRKPRRMALLSSEPFYLRSYHGTYATSVWTDNEGQPWPLSQATTKTRFTLYGETTGLLMFGRAMSMGMTMGTSRALVNFEGAPKTRQIPWPWPNEWVITDPSGFSKTGDRLYYGATVLLHNTAFDRNASASDDRKSIMFSPNSAQWEQWVIEPIQ